MAGTKVLAMYDVRGIQNYIFRSSKVKDAIGASAIVEDIINDALEYAVDKIREKSGISADLIWEEEEGPKQYTGEEADVQVLYIGGGNGVVLFSSDELCKEVNRLMSMYVIMNTYSLQLAVAYVPKSENYSDDYKNLHRELNIVKANMEMARPLGTLPVMDVEIKTGFPKTDKQVRSGDGQAKNVSTEVFLKQEAEDKKRKGIESVLKKFDTYTSLKGVDSTIAVVHIDGNNMGLRIRSLIEDKKLYADAVNEMRKISHAINDSYKKVFAMMEKTFNRGKNYVLKILTAGDDITYICNGAAAVSSVEYFAREIAKLTMNGGTGKADIETYGFSVCAGIAYIGSHFPFSIGYETAEACCDSAKKAAKKQANMDGKRIGNWFDFQICKNVQGKDLERIREEEYITADGEQLCIRPYELPLLNLPARKDALNHFESLKKNILYFQTEKEEQKDSTEKKGYLPRSHSKNLRNTYALGEAAVDGLASFLKSREWQMPDGSLNMYGTDDDGNKAALWYDALELIDDYVSLETIENIEKEGGQENE